MQKTAMRKTGLLNRKDELMLFLITNAIMVITKLYSEILQFANVLIYLSNFAFQVGYLR